MTSGRSTLRRFPMISPFREPPPGTRRVYWRPDPDMTDEEIEAWGVFQRKHRLAVFLSHSPHHSDKRVLVGKGPDRLRKFVDSSRDPNVGNLFRTFNDHGHPDLILDIHNNGPAGILRFHVRVTVSPLDAALRRI